MYIFGGNVVETHKRGKLLLEKIGILIEGIEACLLELKMKDIIVLQKTVAALYRFQREYTEGWDFLNKSLHAVGHVDFCTFIESEEYKHLKVSLSSENEDKNMACEWFMTRVIDTD